MICENQKRLRWPASTRAAQRTHRIVHSRHCDLQPS